MPDHAHKQIRDALKTALTGLVTTGPRVFANRLYPLTDADLPGLRVFTDQDVVEIISIHGPATQAHVLGVVIECVAKANTALDDTLDQIQKEVEIALAGGLAVAGKTLQTLLTASQFTDEPGATAVGVKALSYELTFHTVANAPDVLI